VEDKATLAMKEFLERMKKLQEKTGKQIHYMGCGEYDFTQQAQKEEENGVTGEEKDASFNTINGNQGHPKTILNARSRKKTEINKPSDLTNIVNQPGENTKGD